jgi:diacylglycerol kinase (ATP)
LKIAAVANQGSGSGAAGEAIAALERSGAEVESFEIDRCERIAEAGADRIVVAGGDGSIALAARAASEAGVPLAVIPVGTANDFAARMSLPTDPGEAAELAAGGERTRPVDLAWAGERAFVNVASLGLPPAAAEAAEGMKSALGPLAYAVGALRAGVAADPLACRVVCGGAELVDGEVWQLTVGATGAFGGGSQIEADADDGMLDVVALEAGSRARLAKHAIGMKAGGLESQEGVLSKRCESVEVSFEGSHDLNVDGEVVAADELTAAGRPGTISFTVSHEAFRLVIG